MIKACKIVKCISSSSYYWNLLLPLEIQACRCRTGDNQLTALSRVYILTAMHRPMRCWQLWMRAARDIYNNSCCQQTHKTTELRNTTCLSCLSGIFDPILTKLRAVTGRIMTVVTVVIIKYHFTVHVNFRTHRFIWKLWTDVARFRTFMFTENVFVQLNDNSNSLNIK